MRAYLPTAHITVNRYFSAFFGRDSKIMRPVLSAFKEQSWLVNFYVNEKFPKICQLGNKPAFVDSV